jgi:hypothetical protein
MAITIEEVKLAVGERFKLFRQVLFQSIPEMGEESGMPPDLIQLIEMGILAPDLLSLEYFFREYCLNLTWLVTGKGNIFFAKGPKTPVDVFEFCQFDEPGSPAFERFSEHRRQLHEETELIYPPEKKEEEIPWETQPYPPC